jgi:hypothetical protein
MDLLQKDTWFDMTAPYTKSLAIIDLRSSASFMALKLTKIKPSRLMMFI